MGFRKIDVTEIPGFRLGNAEDLEAGTGCTAIICENGAVAGVDVRGGGPATRETDLLRSENSVQTINCVMLSGGSAFGLEAGSGAMRFLEKKGAGFRMGDICVPIVCQASLYDLDVASSQVRPDREMGEKACENAYSGIFSDGNHGAGTGATVGKYCGMDRAMKSGLGTFACSNGVVHVGAVAAVNAIGDVYNGNGRLIAGILSPDGTQISGSINYLKNAILKDDAPEEEPAGLEKETSTQVHAGTAAEAVQESVPEATQETTAASGSADGDIRGTATEDKTESATDHRDEAAQEAVTDADACSEAAQETEGPAEEIVYDHRLELSSDDLGEDVTFNTTISCLITNAKLTKSQANKLASTLHDGYARSIKPVHGSLDGDTIFVMTTGEVDVNFDAFAALATDTLQYSVINAVTSAEDAYGFPSARTMAMRMQK